jgi:hypothetical protein
MKDQYANSSRQINLDIAKAMAVIFMIMIHVQLSFSRDLVYETGYGVFTEFVGGIPSAPVFMFLLGTGIIYSKKASSKILLIRGIKTFLLGYGLNLARGTVPKLIGFTIGQEIEINEIYIATFIIDILQFSGLAFIAFAGLTKLKLTINCHFTLFYF